MPTVVNATSYDDALDSKWKIVDVPLKIATEENFREYGRLVADIEKEEVSVRLRVEDSSSRSHMILC